MEKVFVNGDEISQEAIAFELDRLVRFYATHGMSQAELSSNMERLRQKAIDQAVGAKLLFLRAEQLDVKVSGDEIDAEVEKVKSQIGGEEAYRNALAAQKITEEDFRKELEKGARVNKLVEQACTGVEEPSEEDVTAFYEAHKSEYVTPEQVLCRHILVKGSDDAALDKIKEIRERILAGASFEEEAKKNSDCPSGANGGSLGWFGPGMMVPEFDKAAFDMSKGEVSSVILTQFGYHIIYKDDEKKEMELSLVEVHDQIKDLLRHNARGEAIEAFVAELRANAKIERR